MDTRLAIVALALALALAVAPAFAAGPASGFLENLPPLKADAQRPAAQVYIAPGGSLRGFNRIALEPIEIWYAPDSKYRGVDPNELAMVVNSFQEILVARLEPKYAVVAGEGEGILGLRIAVTNVKAEKKKRGLLGYTPAGLVVGVVKDAATAGPNIDLKSALIEAEVLDAKGKRLAVIVEPLFAPDEKKASISWKQIGEVLDAYAQRLRARLDADNAP